MVFPHNCLVLSTKQWTTDIGIDIGESQNNYAERKKIQARLLTVWFYLHTILENLYP